MHNTKIKGENISLQPLGDGVRLAVSKNHTFGTDAVLLAHFAAPKKSNRVVDLGTGCGIIPALWLRDDLLPQVYGLELAEEAVALAAQTAEVNGWQDRFRVIRGNIQTPFEHLPKANFHLVTCNPPYFAAGAGRLSNTSADQTARHETACTLPQVISAAAGLLQYGGRFCMCHRPDRLGEIFSLMAQANLQPKRLQLVCKTVGQSPWLLLVEGRLGGGVGLSVLPNLYLYDALGNETKALLEIYGPYRKQGNQATK